ncbi:MAG: class I SAM-dependent methyltransferase [Bacteroidales bacterium]
MFYNKFKKKCKNFIKNALRDVLNEERYVYFMDDISRDISNDFSSLKLNWLDICSNTPLFDKKVEAIIKEKDKDYFKSKYGLYDYHIDFFNELSQRIDLKEKRVLEIGGSNHPRELVIDEAKCRQWICVDKPWIYNGLARENHFSKVRITKFNNFPLVDSEDYIIYDEISDNIPDDFFGKFDVCISNCSIEHINNLPFTIEKIFDCLKPGGKFYASGGPIYSTFNGNHIWINEEVNHNNLPIDLYYKHLLLGYSEMYCEIEKKYGIEFARKHTSEFLSSNCGINRLFYEDYAFIMARSSFSRKSVSPQWTLELDIEIQKKLVAKYPKYSRFDVGAVVICAER